MVFKNGFEWFMLYLFSGFCIKKLVWKMIWKKVMCYMSWSVLILLISNIIFVFKLYVIIY